MTSLVDKGSDSVRFGRGRSIRRVLFSRELICLTEEWAGIGEPEVPTLPQAIADERAVVALLTRSLGTGGVEAVVATLAKQLPKSGVRPVVLCTSGGKTAREMRRDGIDVREVATPAEAALALVQISPDVAESHNAPDFLIEACTSTSIPVVSVIHTNDINMTEHDWARETRRVNSYSELIAVSETVRSYYQNRIRPFVDEPRQIVVVPNGVEFPALSPKELELARVLLCEALAIPSGEEVVIAACLARYDMQKNVPGLVSAFVRAARSVQDLHLVVAGPIEDWIEQALADAIRRAEGLKDRIHLLGPSSTRGVLAAADLFILDSFFEGWPIAATEAAAAGLPLVLADVGGARELVGPEGERGIIVANPANPSSSELTLGDVQISRRRPRRQHNSDAMSSAILSIGSAAEAWRGRRAGLAQSARRAYGVEAMSSAHARILLETMARDANDQ